MNAAFIRLGTSVSRRSPSVSRSEWAGKGETILYRQSCPQLNEGGAALFRKFATHFRFRPVLVAVIQSPLLLLFRIGSDVHPSIKINRFTIWIEEKKRRMKGIVYFRRIATDFSMILTASAEWPARNIKRGRIEGESKEIKVERN